MSTNLPKKDADFPAAFLLFLQANYHYNPKSGLIWRHYSHCSKLLSYEVDLGHFRAKSYFQKKKYWLFYHRLAWFLYYGKFPDNVIDHINNDPTDNRISNLRDITAEANTARALTRFCPHCKRNIYDDLGLTEQEYAQKQNA